MSKDGPLLPRDSQVLWKSVWNILNEIAMQRTNVINVLNELFHLLAYDHPSILEVVAGLVNLHWDEKLLDYYRCDCC